MRKLSRAQTWTSDKVYKLGYHLTLYPEVLFVGAGYLDAFQIGITIVTRHQSGNPHRALHPFVEIDRYRVDRICEEYLLNCLESGGPRTQNGERNFQRISDNLSRIVLCAATQHGALPSFDFESKLPIEQSSIIRERIVNDLDAAGIKHGIRELPQNLDGGAARQALWNNYQPALGIDADEVYSHWWDLPSDETSFEHFRRDFDLSSYRWNATNTQLHRLWTSAYHYQITHGGRQQ